ncbi:putative N-acetylmannosamine-6-phosphate 2-epimerase [Actinoplanes missouriensis 431]|uniref:N-acylglucosamine-6-phosphate 2-epimerase n=1 Tax=Actinoplanes missouriensis (strain ATCC 14538 / DSM 43046 / CBS 188.64 / JCM 3121 / NBRC 102363 / NCIMB 12654 / NRRL B-3342 / UNCC 431) TaxID=512565 RepID=I0H3U6_ACTM4|nr:putative N-acetylmannosamine-6-phosphate 2-epimerase [Actinoplanes missouriensis]BAL87683.1 putative N-acetylmannosamine-6-phosphate 2-epimerase [Actinoplanes missouriensis 431]
MNLDQFAAVISGRLIVSCQAGPDHPLRDTPTIARMAESAVLGGACAIRCGGVGGLDDVRAVAEAVSVPVIGLTKRGRTGVFITPTVDDALAVLEAGATVVATDGTRRTRPDGAPLNRTIDAVHTAGGLVMADVSTEAEGIAAAEAGADLIATTLSGYTPDSPGRPGPDLALVAALAAALPSELIVAEGRYHEPAHVRAARDAGATAVVVGTAITDPAWITSTFAAAV